MQAKEDKTVLDARVMALQRKWSDICQRLHCSSTSQDNITLAKPHTSSAPSLRNVPIQKDTVGVGSLSNGSRITNLSPCVPSDLPKNSLPKQNIPRPVVLSASLNAQAELPVQGLELNNLRKLFASQQKMSLPIACTSSPSVISVATDLTLGTLYDSAEDCRRNPNLQDHCNDVQNSESSRSYEKSLGLVSQSSSCSHHLEKQIYTKDLELQWKVLAEKVYWQMEAIRTISQTVSRCRNGNERYHCSNKGNIWLSFRGPDKVGKRKIAASVAEIVFGRKEHLLSLDLNSQDVNAFNSIVDSYDSKYHKMESGRKMMVDYLAEELSKHPHSVVLLENIEKANFLVQCSLSQAVKTGKFPDSHGRDINLNNNVFILASTVLKVSRDLLFGKIASEFPEETILEAKNLQMQILVGSVDGNYSRNSTTYVSVSPSKIISKQCPSNKRKSINNDLTKAEISKRACQLSRSIIDLNLPVEDMGDDSDIDKSDDGDDSDNSEGWLEKLLDHVDENVVFKPFDFDSLSWKILNEINVRLKKIVGATLFLEIDRQVMVQILAAAWITDRENALEDWIEQVLCLSIDKALQRCNVTSDFVLKLVPCDGLPVEEQASGVCLPATINVN